MYDLVVRNGTVVNPFSKFQADIGIADGRIVEIAKTIKTSARSINADSLFIFPGFIDPHVHIWDPKFLRREDFKSGSTSAAAGGITCFIDMPTDTPLTDPKGIEEKIQTGERQSVVDFSLHAGNMTAGDIKNIDSILSLGINSFKSFTCDPYLMEESVMCDLFQKLKEKNAMGMVHCEDNDIIKKHTEKFKAQNNPMMYPLSRPDIAEVKAIERVCSMAKDNGNRLHIVHISTKDSMEKIKASKNERTSCEVCTHHLMFSRKDMESKGAYLKMNPPLREKLDITALWNGLINGDIHVATTDHFCCLPEEKEVGIWEAPAGVPGIETLVPIILSEGVHKRKMRLERAAQVLSYNAAKIFGLYSMKGEIKTGADADLTIVDMKLIKKLKSDDLHSKVGWSPYEGMKFKGWPVYGIVRGNVVMENGDVYKNKGKFIKR